MPTQIHGLPTHVLLIHVVVVLVPVAAALLVAQAWSRPVRRWAGVLGPLLCLGALVMVPVTTSAGKWLRNHINPQLAASDAVRRHAHLGNQLLPWVVGMFVLSVAVWLLGRRSAEAREQGPPAMARTPALLPIAVAVLATVVAAGAVVQTVRIGDSGAKAVWTGSVVTK